MKPKLWLSWSSGKDSAWALHALHRQGTYEVAGLLTTINAAASRVAMHAVRETLLERQAAAAGVCSKLKRMEIDCLVMKAE